MQSSVGSIVKLKNVIFKTCANKRKCDIDHSFFSGRPAIIICETEDTLYHLLITHNGWRKPNIVKDYPLPDDLNTKGFVKFNEIHARNLCYEEEYCCVSDEYLLKILLLFVEYQETDIQDEEYPKIKPLILEKIDELTSNLEKSKKKIKK